MSDVAKTGRFEIRFWGVRGSIACAGRDFDTYGGNTPCVEMRVGEHLLVFDAGSGARGLGSSLLRRGIRRFDLFFSHCHYDHIEGMPFFEPLYDPAMQIAIWSGHHLDGSTTEDMLSSFMQAPFFPVGPEVFRAQLDLQTFRAGDVLEPYPGIVIETVRLHHGNGSVGYRVEHEGRAVCYVTDTEHPEFGRDETVIDLIRGSDLVIYDTMYTPEEYHGARGFGHSTWLEGVELCDAAAVHRLVLFHHNPRHDDRMLASLEAEAARQRPGTLAAREGMVISL
jgi:phosphoribosyl 1,2-cyclic phosphodiesterase